MGSRPEHDRLVEVIRSTRRRWRLRVVMRGAAIVVGAALLVLLVSAFGMDRFRFNPTAVVVFRAFAYVSIGLLIIRFLALPLVRRVSDERVALYLEEHEPTLEARLLSAVELAPSEAAASYAFSPALIERLVQNAVERCASIDFGRRVEARPLARSSGLLAGSTVAVLAVFLLAPSFLRHSGPYLFPFRGDAPSNPYGILVTPGNARVARGAELKIEATLQNFSAERAEIVVQSAGAEWERFPMNFEDDVDGYVFFLFDLEEQTEYFVEAGGIRSSLFRVEVADLPYVQTLTLEYHFPDYTGLSSQRVEDGGDIAVVRGTEVRFYVTPTIPVAAGAIAIEGADTLPLAATEDGTLIADMKVSEDGLYRIVFESLDGDRVAGSPDYLIDVLSDQPPVVSFRTPGRDVSVTNIEEVFVEAEAEDDYGVQKLELIYSVNGGPEATLDIYQGRRRDVVAGHTFFLEELELVPGDFISYYARATDGRAGGRGISTTDIYFMEVRPFNREFRQADQGGAGGGAAGGFDSSLAQRQREIIAATFNVVRDRKNFSEEQYQENLATLALAQGRLREQVERLVSRINARGILEMDSSFKTVAEALPLAGEAMREAEQLLGEREPEDALSPERRALQHLQRAEAAFREFQVGRGQQAGGGGAAPDVEQLAELFELELDKQRNQYESVQRNQQQQLNQQIDETLQKLQELARRQQQENERLKARISESQSQGGSGNAQRQLAEEAEELARKLERLAREQSAPELQRTARELREAAEQMRRAAASRTKEGATDGSIALERLKEARRLLDQSRAASLEREVDDALRRAERLAEQQRQTSQDVERLGEGGRNQLDRMQRVVERKEQMAEEVADLEAQLDRLARESRREQRDASRKLQEAANTIRDDKLEDKIRYSRGVVQQRTGEYARNFEEQIARDIDNLRETIGEARDAIGVSKEQRLSRNLDRARDIVRSLESLEERTQQAQQAEAQSEAPQDRQAQQGEQSRAEGDPSQRSDAAAGQQRTGSTPRDTDTADGFPGYTRQDIRQFRREFGERRGEIERLRSELEEEGIDVRELDAILERIRRLERDRSYGDPRGLAELQEQIIQGLKEFEYMLRRQLASGEARELLLTGSDEVPEGYRQAVEEYYRALAEQGTGNR